jgi:hypothetical protein
MEYSGRRSFPSLLLGLIGVALQLIGREELGWVLIGLAVIFALYYYGGGYLGLVTFPPLPWRQRISQVRSHGLSLRVHKDYGGEEEVFVGPGWLGIYADDDGKVFMASAGLDVEIRNVSDHPVRISEIYMEIRTVRLIHRLLEILPPTKINRDREWYKRRHPRRVEWLIEPHSEGLHHDIVFEEGWPHQDGPLNGRKKYTVALVLELDGGIDKIRLFMEDDVLAKPQSAATEVLELAQAR